jgi:hypothetical protein
VFVLALACSAVSCRRAPPPAEPVKASLAPAATAPQASAVPSQEPQPARASAPAPDPAAATLPVIELPPPIIRTAEPKKAEEQRDERMYSWVDEQGAVHYGSAEDVPDSRRRSARVVDSGGVTIVPPPPLEGVAPAEASATPPQDASSPAEPGVRGPEPQRDAQGLPIPGTMDDTAATRASRAAGELQLDPAAVQRRHEEELRRLNCKLKDGVWICG